MLAAQIAQAGGHAVFVDVRDRHQLDLARRAQGLVRGTGAPTAATDQCNLQLVTARRMGRALDAQPAQQRTTDGDTGCLQETAA
jgi:hypothetical protein